MSHWVILPLKESEGGKCHGVSKTDFFVFQAVSGFVLNDAQPEQSCAASSGMAGHILFKKILGDRKLCESKLRFKNEWDCSFRVSFF